MRKSLLIIVLMLLLIEVKPVWASFPNPITDGITYNEAVFNDITDDFEIFNNLLAKPALNKAEGINRLSVGFESSLAAAIIDYYFQPDPDLNCMTAICTESIPFITEADRDLCQITLLDDHTARLERVYTDCYYHNDQWLYQVTAEKSGRWKIIDLNLIPIASPYFPFNP